MSDQRDVTDGIYFGGSWAKKPTKCIAEKQGSKIRHSYSALKSCHKRIRVILTFLTA